MTPTRRRRLIVISLILVAVAIAAMLTVFALQQNMTYLFSPSEVHEGRAPNDARFRLGGVVEEHSVKRGDSLEVEFVVTDRFQTIPVVYTGILPDLFREGQGVVAEGKLDGKGMFIADTVLAKHDENYMPKEVADKMGAAHRKHDVKPAQGTTPASEAK